MDPLVNPAKDPAESIPPWIYGAISGGIAALSAAGVTIYHFVSRKRRYAAAEVEAAKLRDEQLENGTPRAIP